MEAFHVSLWFSWVTWPSPWSKLDWRHKAWWKYVSTSTTPHTLSLQTTKAIVVISSRSDPGVSVAASIIVLWYTRGLDFIHSPSISYTCLSVRVAYPIWHWMWRGVHPGQVHYQSITGLAHRHRHVHTYGQFRIPSYPTCLWMGAGQRSTGREHANSIQKSPSRPVWTQNPLDVRWQCKPLHHHVRPN